MTLDQLIQDYSGALEQRDWQTLGSLDERMKPVVEAAVQQSDMLSEAELEAKLTCLAELNQRAYKLAVQERDSVAAELKGLVEGRAGVAEYSVNSLL